MKKLLFALLTAQSFAIAPAMAGDKATDTKLAQAGVLGTCKYASHVGRTAYTFTSPRLVVRNNVLTLVVNAKFLECVANAESASGVKWNLVKASDNFVFHASLAGHPNQNWEAKFDDATNRASANKATVNISLAQILSDTDDKALDKGAIVKKGLFLLVRYSEEVYSRGMYRLDFEIERTNNSDVTVKNVRFVK